jgi:dTDP-4-dehydrorhamnose reductase
VRILVTGREGQVARSLAERARGNELVFAARPDFDLADPASIERIVAAANPDLVISAAAYTAVDKAEDEPDLAMSINGEAPGVLARAAARAGARVLHLSTDYVFDGTLGRPYREDDPVAPIGAYGASKLAGEQAIAASGARYAILRTAWVYSPFGSNFVRTMLRLAESRDALDVVEDQRGNPSSALDIAGALMAVVGTWQANPARGADAIYHVAGTGETDWAGFARTVFALSAARGGPSAEVRGIPASGYPTRARRPANSRLDCEKFAATFGWRAPDWRRSTEQVIARLVP